MYYKFLEVFEKKASKNESYFLCIISLILDIIVKAQCQNIRYRLTLSCKETCAEKLEQAATKKKR